MIAVKPLYFAAIKIHNFVYEFILAPFIHLNWNFTNSAVIYWVKHQKPKSLYLSV